MINRYRKFYCALSLFWIILIVVSCADNSAENNNSSVDKIPPELNNAVVNNLSPNTIKLAFNEAVTIDNITGISLNVLSGNGAISLLNFIDGSGTSIITITTSRQIMNNEIVTISYDNSIGSLKDLSGNKLVNFLNANIQTDTLKPSIICSYVDVINHNKINVKFDEPVEINNKDGFIITYGGGTFVIINFAGSGTSEISFYLESEVFVNDSVTLEYNPSSGNVKDFSGNALAIINSVPIKVDFGSPYLKDAYDSDGYVILEFSEAINIESSEGFTVTLNGSVVEIVNFYPWVDYGLPEYLTFELEIPITQTDEVTIEYDSEIGTLKDTVGNSLMSFEPRQVRI